MELHVMAWQLLMDFAIGCDVRNSLSCPALLITVAVGVLGAGDSRCSSGSSWESGRARQHGNAASQIAHVETFTPETIFRNIHFEIMDRRLLM